MYCRECGTLIHGSSKFCQNCGEKIISEEPLSNNSDVELNSKEESVLAGFFLNRNARIYLLYVAINISLLLIFSDNIFGNKNSSDNVFWPFGSSSLGEYDITEFLFYTIVPPVILYFWGSQIKKFLSILGDRIKNISKNDYRKLLMTFIFSLSTSFFLSSIYFRSSEVGKFDFNLTVFVSAVIIGGFAWMIFFGLVAFIWQLLKLSVQKLRRKDYSFTFSDWLSNWTNCSLYLGAIIVLANIFLNK